MKVHLVLCLIIIDSSYALSTYYNDLCFKRHGDYLKHLSDCHKFIRCSHGQAYEFQCPGNLWWHQEVKSCDYAYRSKCKLNTGILSNYADRYRMDDSVNNSKPVTGNAKKQLTTTKTHLTQQYIDNDKTQLSVEQDTKASLAEPSDVYLIPDIMNLPSDLMQSKFSDLSTTINPHFEQFFAASRDNFVTDNILQLTTKQYKFNTTDSKEYNVLDFPPTEDTVIVTEQFIDISKDAYVSENILELSTTQDIISSTESKQYNVIVTQQITDAYTATESTVNENFIQSTTAFTKNLKIDNVTKLPIAVTFSEYFTTESTTELSTKKNIVNLTESFTVNSTVLNVSKLSIEEITTLDKPPELSSKAAHNSADTNNLTENLLVKFSADLNVMEPSTDTLTAKLITTTKLPFSLSYNENETETNTEMLKVLTNPTKTPTITDNIALANVISNNNNYAKKLFIKPNKLLTLTSKPSDTTTQDPRLPFRAYECQGENNRQQFKALKCYQYYQCFAGWAFLLNCYEGWWFQPDMKRCVQIEDNECGY